MLQNFTPPTILKYLKKIRLPLDNSHKGQNGKLLIIGGSELFHAASKWSLDVASKFVDMVFYSSVPDNNELIKQAKAEFWNGIVVPRGEVESYLKEADCILIGPGMERGVDASIGYQNLVSEKKNWNKKPTPDEWKNDTARIVNYLLATYPNKKWVVDAGALQMVEPRLLNKNCIITPHHGELERVLGNLEYEVCKYVSMSESHSNSKSFNKKNLPPLEEAQKKLDCTILLKGREDTVSSPDLEKPITIVGGNPGMTKGGTGDVLSGLVAALYCTHDALTSAVVGSYINKQAGDKLYTQVGPYFNASDLVEMVPKTMWKEVWRLQKNYSSI